MRPITLCLPAFQFPDFAGNVTQKVSAPHGPVKRKIRDHSAEERLFIRRAGVALALVVVCFGALIVNLYRLQIRQHGFYQTRSNQNDIKMLPIAPAAG